jgi:hypothetical protein
MTAYQFAVLQYMPDAIRQETINVGVAVAIPGAACAEVRVLKQPDAARLKWLGVKDDIEFLRQIAGDLREPAVPTGGTAADALVLAHTDWGGTIRVSELRAALHDDARELCDELYQRYVANPRTRRRSEYRDRGTARRQVRKALRERLPKESVQPAVQVNGRFEEHKFDLGVGNGQLLHAIATFSFDLQDSAALQTEVDACAWAISDVRTVTHLPITVVTIGGTTQQLDRTQAMYETLGARLIREANIDRWARGMASELEYLHGSSISHGQQED